MNPPKEPTFDERIADWLEGLDDRAPGHALDAVIAASRSIPQRRAWGASWRLRPMNRFTLVGATAAVGLVLIIGGVLVANPRSGSGPGVGGAPPSSPQTAQPSDSPTPSLTPVIPDGAYLGVEQQVSDILDRLAGDPTLTDAEKTSIIDTILGIRGATTFQTRIEVDGSSMIVSQGVDGTVHPEQWSITTVADKRISAQAPSGGTIEFEVRGCGLPGSFCGYTFQALSPAPSNVEAFVRRLVFEISGPFAPQE